MTTTITNIIQKYQQILKNHNVPIEHIILFGSHAKGKAHEWSDIDVAVISNKLKKNYEINRAMLRNICMDVDIRIEPHGFTEEDFKDNSDPLAYEIRKTGIKVD